MWRAANTTVFSGNIEKPMARRRKKRSFIPRSLIKLILAALASIATLYGGLQLPGKVLSVQDGDTITLLSGKTGLQKVRVYGIDCPESRQQGGMEATAFTQGMVFLEEVSLTVMDKDQYGREVALVTLPDGRTLNEELVREGHAWVYASYCKIPQCARWKYLEAQARREKKGLWAKKNPVPPWRWRKANR